MNPFLDDPVARPLAVLPRLAAGSPVAPTVPSRPVQPPSAPARRWRRVAGQWALVAGVGVAGGTLAATATAATAAAPAAALAGLNVNIATVAQLESVKGIGPKTAALIVRERERAGPYSSFQDFAERIRGIGPKRAAALRALGLGVSSTPPGGGPRP